MRDYEKRESAFSAWKMAKSLLMSGWQQRDPLVKKLD